MTHKDCVHYEVCKEYLIECTEHGEAERILNPCAEFKNKIMDRFVKHFHNEYDKPLIEEQINEYAVKRNLTIITIAPLYQNGMFVLFEKKGGADNG